MFIYTNNFVEDVRDAAYKLHLATCTPVKEAIMALYFIFTESGAKLFIEDFREVAGDQDTR